MLAVVQVFFFLNFSFYGYGSKASKVRYNFFEQEQISMFF